MRFYGTFNKRNAERRKAKNMSMIQDVSAEQLAKLFHHYQQTLAHDCEKHDGEEGSSPWDRASQQERKLMVAAARLALLELSTTPEPVTMPEPVTKSRPYFAQPGEADWGC
jgi:hypothetical protein